jgi:hypothetical protein
MPGLAWREKERKLEEIVRQHGYLPDCAQRKPRDNLTEETVRNHMPKGTVPISPSPFQKLQLRFSGISSPQETPQKPRKLSKPPILNYFTPEAVTKSTRMRSTLSNLNFTRFI